MFPSRKQWNKWSLLSKLSALGVYLGAIGIMVTIVVFAISFIGKKSASLNKTILAEADRRNSLLNNVFDQINNELKNDNTKNRVLSDELIGRIVVLSKSFKPYRLLKDEGNRVLSPERGLLLAVLVRSKLAKTSYDNIYYFADFTYADLGEYDLSYCDAYLRNCKLSYSSLVNTKLFYSDLRDVDLKEANLENVNLFEANLERANLSGANLKGAQLSGSFLKDVNLSNANLTESDLRNADLSDVNIENSIIDDALVDKLEWFQELIKWNVKGIESINHYYVYSERFEIYVKNPELVKSNRTGRFYMIKKK